MPVTCRFGRIFARCGEPGVGSCQYCARPFCARHGHLGDEGEQICARPVCQAKHTDLVEHIVFRARAHLRNRHGMCGIDGCLGERWGQCSKCEGLFCEEHLFDRADSVRQGRARYSRPASFCAHCLRRRKLWARA